ncbi:Pyrroline-5-carboxylate reductase [bioreactor metagenome]|uniref:Pyrroline-5-carboxylate reductase n=1 Tax=bioreactor metagenome TaxID=1076179 RepID=A0A644UHQ5_9ZZZZ|nr:pyrroline-5-carboxylate reductase [Acidaminococcaceae bacterium]
MGKIITTGKVAFIGCGAMGEAILKGLLAANMTRKEEISVSLPTAARRDYLAKEYGVKTFSKNNEVVNDADIVILAVKPQMFDTALGEDVVAAIPEKATIVSIMGSVDLAKLHKIFKHQAVIRVMPNTPLAVGCGMTAIAPDDIASGSAVETVKAIFGVCGEVVEVQESAMDAITAISGCGPGYVFVLIDALADAGVNVGLPRALAIKLAAQTFAGAGKMAVETGLHPAQLRDQVTSPGGTTIAGLHALELHGVRGAMYDAVSAVLKRNSELKGK